MADEKEAGQVEAPEAPAVKQAEPEAKRLAQPLEPLLQRPIHTPSAMEIVGQAQSVGYLAKIMYTSRLAPPDLQNQGEAAITMVMMKGLELNIPPVLAIENLHIIKGRIAMSARLIFSSFSRSRFINAYINSARCVTGVRPHSGKATLAARTANGLVYAQPA